MIERIEALPGVESAGAIHLLPLSGNNWGARFHVEGEPTAPGAEVPETDWRIANPGYFSTLRIPLVRGRFFSEQDRRDAPPVALVNATLARRHFLGEDPIGKRIWTDFEGEGNWVTVVGVVGDTKDLGLQGAPRPQLYRPFGQRTSGGMTLMVRTGSDPLGLASMVREAIWSVDRNVPISDLQPFERVVQNSIAQPRLLMVLLLIFGGIALTLGSVGIYGVISHVVGQRTREFGVRMALGARTGDVLRLVLKRGLALISVGVAAGVVLAFAATRLLSGMIYGISATDPRTFVTVSLFLAAVALLAAYIPARRATRVDPIIALRAE